MIISRGKLIASIIFLSITLSSRSSFSQVGQSPYSSIGIGDILDPTTASKFGMGGLGISNWTYFSLNIKNPALLHYNRVALFSFAILAEKKKINQTGIAPYKSGSAQLNHIGFAFPLILGKLTTSLVLNPYSSVDYSISYSSPIEGHPNDSAYITSEGDGGIDQLSWSLGGKLTDKISIGIKASYLFSSIRKKYTSYALLTPTNNYIATIDERVSFHGFIVGLGLAYKYTIDETSIIDFGLTYDLKKDIRSNSVSKLNQETITGGAVFSDTLSDDASLFNIPSKLALGLSYRYKQLLVVGLDYTVQDWTKNKDFIYSKKEKIVFGSEITPDINSLDNYLKKITYRVGISYTKTPYILENSQISDFGINFGVSLPVTLLSRLDFGFQVGSKGEMKNNLIKEDYFKVYFGISFNDNRWFKRPKFN